MPPDPIVRTPQLPIPPRGTQGLVDHANALHRMLFNNSTEQNTKINELLTYFGNVEVVLAALYQSLGTINSNSNGGWVTLPGGLQIAWRYLQETVAFGAGTGTERTWTFPQAFTDPPIVLAVAGVATGGTTGVAAQVSAGLPSAATTTAQRIHFFNNTGSALGGFSYAAIAIGPNVPA